MRIPAYGQIGTWLGALLLAALPGLLPNAAGAVETGGLSTLFWCPMQPGKELQIKPALGCQPLVEEEKKPDEKKPEKRREMAPVNPEQNENAVSSFLKEYRNFLACCANDPDPEKLEELEDRASALIKETTKNISAALILTRAQSLIVPVARARDELRDLKRKTSQLSDAKDRLEEVGYEQAGRERRKVQDLEDSINREFTPKRGPSRAPTGTDIGGTGPTGTAVGKSAPTGTDIGKTSTTGTKIGNQPPTLGELIDTPPGSSRNRENTLTTTEPVSSGKVGPDIESTMGGGSSTNSGARTGAAIGDSSFNR